MYAAQGTIQAYDGATDTATVELTGLGIIDAWFEGVRISSAVPRAQVVAGAPCTITTPDASRLCEAIVVSIDRGYQSQLIDNGGTQLAIQTLRAALATDAAGGGGPATVSWPSPFSAGTPTVYATPDSGTVALSAISTTGATIQLTAAKPSTTVYITLVAEGAR